MKDTLGPAICPQQGGVLFYMYRKVVVIWGKKTKSFMSSVCIILSEVLRSFVNMDSTNHTCSICGTKNKNIVLHLQ